MPLYKDGDFCSAGTQVQMFECTLMAWWDIIFSLQEVMHQNESSFISHDEKMIE